MKMNSTRTKTGACLVALSLGTVLAAPADETSSGSERNYTGVIASVSPQDHVLNLKGMFAAKHFNVGDGCAYRLTDNQQGTLSALRPGEKVRVSYVDQNGVLVAGRIEEIPMQYEGQVRAIDPVNHTLTIHVRALDKDFKIADGCQVILRNDKAGTFAEVQPGDHVTVTYEKPGGVLTARKIAQTSMTFSGSLVAIDLPARTVKAKEGFETKKFNLADNCVIMAGGKPDGRLDNLKPEDRLVFDYDEINGVDIVNRIAPAQENNPTVVTTTPGQNY